MNEKQALTDTLVMHYTLFRNKAVFDQLKSGLSILGVAGALSQYSKKLEPMFAAGKRDSLTASKILNYYLIKFKVSADVIKDMLKVYYSEPGTTERAKEEAT